MRSHAKAPTVFTFGRKGFVAHALVALALAALFALSLASSANAADRHIDSYVGPKPVDSPNTPGGVFSSIGTSEIAIYTGNDADPSNDKVFTVEANPNHRVQRLDAADNSFERMWGKDTIVGNPGTGYEICVAPTTCKSGTVGTSAKGEFDDSVAIAVDQEDPTLGGEGSVYVYDRDNHRIQKFDLDGNFIAMFGDNVNQTTTGDVCTQESGDVCKTGVGGTAAAQIGPSGSSSLFPTLAVDPQTHDVYVADPTNRRIQQWSGSGAFERLWGWDVSTSDLGNGFEVCVEAADCKATGAGGTENGRFASNQPLQVAVDEEGVLYASDSNFNGRVMRFDTTEATAVDMLSDPIAAPLNETQTLSFSGTWVNGDTFTIGNLPSACTASVTDPIVYATGGTTRAESIRDALGAKCGGGANFSVSTSSGPVITFQGAFAGTDVPTTTCTKVAGAGTCAINPTTNGSTGPLVSGATTIGLEAAGDHVYVLRRTQGGVETRIQEINPAGTGVLSTSPPVAEVGQLSRDEIDGFRGLGFHPVDGRLYVPVNGVNPFESCPFPDPTTVRRCAGFFVLDADGVNAPTVTIGAASEVTDTSATLAATINPTGTASYRFEYSKDGVSWTKAAADVTLSGGSQPISQSITGLTPNTLYRVRIVTTKIHGVEAAAVQNSISAEATFVTDALPPTVATYSTSRYGTTTAVLAGLLNPNGSPSTYRFEWGKSTGYGNKVPVPNASAGAGTANKGILAEISGLQPGALYHYRLCAESPQGEACGADKTFTTRVDFGPSAPARAWEMMTPPFKALPQFGGMSAFGNNPNPGIPSLDGEAMLWANGHFPLSDEVDSPNSGDTRLMRRTPTGWTFETRNTLALSEQCTACAPGESLPPVFARVYASASSGDMGTLSYMVGSGNNPEFLPSEGPRANRLYTRRDGSGVEGWTPWLTNPSEQVGSNAVDYSEAGGNHIDDARFDDDGTAMARWGFYRDLAEDPDTPGDEDPSDQQLRDPSLQNGPFGRPGGRTVYLQRAETPEAMPAAPKDLVNECTGTGSADGTQIPIRLGSGAAADTIGIRSCWSSPGAPEATGTGTVSVGSNTITSLDTDSGSFAVDQMIKGPGIPPQTLITAVGPGTLTLSAANTSAPKASGSGQVSTGSNVISSVTTTKGAFAVGQKVRVAPVGFGFIAPPPYDATITAIGAGTLTVDATPTGLFFDPEAATLAVSELPNTPLEADSLHVTSVRGAALGFGDAKSSLATFSQGAMSEDGSRVFFQSPDTVPETNLPASGCASATGVASTCVTQLYVRQYDEDGDPAVRWISRAQGVGTQRVAALGRGAHFEGASRDGRYVYFKTNAPLLPSDPNGGSSITNGSASDKSFDLYRYELPESLNEDPANGTLTRISGGPTGAADPSTNNSADLGNIQANEHPPGSGASLRYLSDDGALAYFVTTSPIAGADSTAPQGVSTAPGGEVGNGARASGIRNLYLFDNRGPSPQWRYIASLPFSADLGVNAGAAALNSCASFQLPVEELGSFNSTPNAHEHVNIDSIRPEGGNCFRGTADGKHVLFQTAGRLTGDDVDDASDLYLYDYEKDDLTRVTAPPSGVSPYRCNVDGFVFIDGYCNGDIGLDISGDGQALSTGLVSLKLASARGWGGGRYYNLASNPDGTVSVFFQSKSNLVPEDNDSLGRHDVYEWREGKLTLMTPQFPEAPYWYSGSSLDGEDLFVNTPARIDPRELDDNDHDIYDLRVGGGFPYTPPPTSCDVLAHECRSTAAPNPEPRSAASAGFSGEGNFTQKAKTKARRCGKGKVRVKGRCVKAKRKANRSKKAIRRATNESGRAGR